MQFSSRVAIAVHIIVAIHQFEGQFKTTSGFLAGSLNVNPVIVRNTMGQLKAAGLVHVRAGEGGASLARDPEEITLLDIFRAVEKEECLFRFHEAPNPQCPVGRNIHAILDGRLDSVEKVMYERMKQITVAGMLRDLEEILEEDTMT